MPLNTVNKFSKKSLRVLVAASLVGTNIGYGIMNPAYAEGDPPEITGGITIVAQQITQDDPTLGDTGSSISVDLNFEKEVGDGKVTVYINHSEGFDPSPGANSDYEGASGTQGDADYDAGFTDTRVAEAKYELPINDELTVTVGKMSPQAYFDGNNVANDQTRQFLGGPFVNNPAIDFPGHMANHAYPGGVHASFAMSDTVTLQGAFLEDAEDYSGKFQKTFIIGEADVAMELLDGETNIRLIYYQSEMNDLTGMAVSADQTYADDYILFARYGQRALAPEAADDDIKTSMSIGAQGPLGDYTFGVGYAITNPNKVVVDEIDAETWMEAYVQYELAEGVLGALDYQVIKNPGFDVAFGEVTVIGARLQVDF